MKKLLLFAAVAGFGLVSASPPDKGPEPGPREARHYPPCSHAVQDSCIQVGRHHARHDAARAGGVHAARAPAAANRQLAHRVRRAGERG